MGSAVGGQTHDVRFDHDAPRVGAVRLGRRASVGRPRSPAAFASKTRQYRVAKRPRTRAGARSVTMPLAKVEAIVTKSISGHQTDRMREHYSTVTPDEQRASIGNVVQLFGRKSGEGSGEGHHASGEETKHAARD